MSTTVVVRTAAGWTLVERSSVLGRVLVAKLEYWRVTATGAPTAPARYALRAQYPNNALATEPVDLVFETFADLRKQILVETNNVLLIPEF